VSCRRNVAAPDPRSVKNSVISDRHVPRRRPPLGLRCDHPRVVTRLFRGGLRSRPRWLWLFESFEADCLSEFAGLTAGGRWIQTSSTAAQELGMFHTSARQRWRHHFVKMPAVTRPRATPAQPSRDRGTKFQNPAPERLLGDVKPAFGRQLLDVAILTMKGDRATSRPG